MRRFFFTFIYFLNEFLKIYPLQPDFKDKKNLFFRTAPWDRCEKIIKELKKSSRQIVIITSKEEVLNPEGVTCIYYNTPRLAISSLSSFQLKDIRRIKYDNIIIPVNSEKFEDYQEIVKLAQACKVKKIYIQTLYGDFFEAGRLYSFKAAIRLYLGRGNER